MVGNESLDPSQVEQPDFVFERNSRLRFHKVNPLKVLVGGGSYFAAVDHNGYEVHRERLLELSRNPDTRRDGEAIVVALGINLMGVKATNRKLGKYVLKSHRWE